MMLDSPPRPPFGLRTPTACCRWQEEAGELATGALSIGQVTASGDADPLAAPRAKSAPGTRLLAATERDQLRLTELRPTAAPGFVTASARLTGLRQWLTVSAHRAELAALSDGAAQVSSLWLTAIAVLREEAVASQQPQWLWLLSLDDSQRVRLNPDGTVELTEVPTGLNRLIDLVQREMKLHFRSSAFDLLFNEEFDWETAPPAILAEFLKPWLETRPAPPAGQSLAVVGLGPRLSALATGIARLAGLKPWEATLYGAHLTTPMAFESWLLRQTAHRADAAEGPPFTATFDGPPLLLPPLPRSTPAAAEAANATEENPPANAPAHAPTGAANQASGRRRHHRSPGRRRPGGKRRLSARVNDTAVRKIVFVVIWVVLVAIGGHMLIEQSTEHARESQGR